MSYMVVCRSEPPQATVVPTVMDALSLARLLAANTDEKVTVMADGGWVLTLDEMEELVRS